MKNPYYKSLLYQDYYLVLADVTIKIKRVIKTFSIKNSDKMLQYKITHGIEIMSIYTFKVARYSFA